MSVAGVCTGPGVDGVGICGREVFRDDRCAAHVKQAQRNGGRLTPIDTLTPWQRVEESRISLEDALKSDETEGLDGDEYEARCEKANRAFRRAVEAFSKRTLSTEDRDRLVKLERDAEVYRRHREAIRAAHAKRRARGLHVGRPARISPARIAEAVEELLKPISKRAAVSKAARRLGLTTRSVWRALRRNGDKSQSSVTSTTEPPSGGPQPG